MRRRDLVKLLEDNGWYFKRSGGNHDLYTNGNKTEAYRDIQKLTRCLRKRLSSDWGFSPGT